MLDLGNVGDLLHVGCVASGTEDDAGAGRLVDVRRRDEGTGGVVDQRNHLDGSFLEA